MSHDDPTRSRALRRALAVGAATLLAATGVVATSGAASADPSTVTLRPSQLTLTESRYNGHTTFEASGVHIVTDDSSSLSKAAGYFTLNLPLGAVGEPAIDVTGTGPLAGMQMVTDFDGDGVSDGILVGEPAVYGNDWWVSGSAAAFVRNAAPSNSGGFGSQWHGTLDQWRSAFPAAQVLQGGYSLGSGVQGDQVISSITYGTTTYAFGDAVPGTRTLRIGDLDLSESRTAGHSHIGGNGLEVNTDDNTSQAKAAGYFALAGGPLPLAAVGQPELHWTGSTPAPGNQLVVDFNGDGQPDGILVGESVYGDNWWTSGNAAAFVRNRAPSCNLPGVSTCNGGGFGSDWNGTLANWQAAFPQAKVIAGGYSLGSGILGSGTIASMVVGDTSYSFANSSPAPQDATASTAFGTPVSVTVAATDPDGDSPEYTHAPTSDHGGTVSGAGADLTYTPAPGFAGTDTFSYTADDTISDAATGTVTVHVGKASTALSVRFSPAHPTSAQVVKAIITAGSAGAVDGGGIVVTSGSSAFEATIGASGEATITLMKYTGTGHTVSVSYAGTANTAASSTTAHFTVAKVESGLALSTSPANVTSRTTGAKAIVHVSAPGASTSGGRVTLAGTRAIGSATVSGGKASIALPRLTAGVHRWTLTYAGTSTSTPSVLHVQITIPKG